MQSVEERFDQMRGMCSVFGFLYDVHSLQILTTTQIMEHCIKLESALQHGDSKDIDAGDLCSELQMIARRLKKSVSPQDVFKFVIDQKLTVSQI